MEHFAKIAHQVARSEYFDYLKSKFPFQSMIVCWGQFSIKKNIGRPVPPLSVILLTCVVKEVPLHAPIT